MALTKIPASLLDTSSGLDLSGNITLGNNERIRIGDGPDLEIYHDGSHSYIDDSGTGNLRIRAGNLQLQRLDGSQNYLAANTGAEVVLYYAGNKKFETSSAGATVTGTLTVTGDLDITGDINSSTVNDLDVVDKTITLGAGQTEANSSGSGIIIDGSGASILWDESNTEWDFNSRINVPSAFSLYYSIRESGTQYGFIGQHKTVAGTGTDTSLSIFSETGDGINFLVNGSVTKALVINSSGKVSVGRDTATHKLHVHDSTTGTGSNYIRVSHGYDSSAVNRKVGIILGTDSSNLGSTWRIESDSSLGYQDNARLQFIHNGGGTDANRMTLRHSGKLGVGTQSPSSYVHAGLGNQALGFDAGFWASANPSDYTVGRGAGITMQNADVYTGGIYGIREANNWQGALVFYTHTNSSGNTFDTTFTEKMRIGSSGYVGIGTDSPNKILHLKEASPNILLEGTNYPALKFAGTDLTIDAEIYYGIGASDLQFVNHNNGVMAFSTNGSAKLSIGNDGVLVGSGGGSPAFYEGSGLEIERAGISTIRLQNTSTVKSFEYSLDSHMKLEALNSSMDIQLRPSRRVEIGAPPSGQMGMLDIYKASGSQTEIVQRIWNSNTSWQAESLTRYYADNFSGSFPVADIGFYRGDTGDSNSSGFIVKTGTTASNVSEKFKVDALGNVLIRNTTGQKLSLENTSAAPTNSVSNAPYIEFKGNGWDSNAGSEPISAKIEHVGVYGDYGYGATQGALVFSLQGAGGLNSAPETMQEGMRIAAGGDDIGTPRVGIGTTDPKAALHVVGSGQFDMLTIERSASTPGLKFVSGADTAGTFGFQLMDNNEWWAGHYDGTNYNYWIQSNQDVLRVKKPISSFTDSGTKQYSHLCTGSFYQSTGAIVIDTNIPSYNSTGNANMFSIKIRGYEYAVHGSIDMNIGGYVGENNHYSVNYNGNYIPEGWVDQVSFCKNNTTGKLAIVLGSTAAIQRIELAVVDFIQGFQNVNESYANGWSMSCLTSLSNYSFFTSVDPRISSPRPGFHAYLSSNTSFANGTAARILGNTSYNRGGHYNTSNGRFTCPNDGIYHFDMSLQMASSSVNQTYISSEIRVNGGTRYIGGWYNKTTGGNNNNNTYSAANGSVTIQLGRGDYVEFVCELSNTDTALGGGPGYTYLSGVQIG